MQGGVLPKFFMFMPFFGSWQKQFWTPPTSLKTLSALIKEIDAFNTQRIFWGYFLETTSQA